MTRRDEIGGELTDRTRARNVMVSLPSSLLIALVTLVIGSGGGGFVAHRIASQTFDAQVSRVEFEALRHQVDTQQQTIATLQQSAVLTTYRLDRIDEGVKAINTKLDRLTERSR